MQGTMRPPGGICMKEPGFGGRRSDTTAPSRSTDSATLWACTRPVWETSRSAHDGNVHTPIFIVGCREAEPPCSSGSWGHPEVSAAGELATEFQRCLNWHADTFPGLYPTPASVSRLAGIDLAGVGSDYLARTVHWARGKRMMVDKNPGELRPCGGR